MSSLTTRLNRRGEASSLRWPGPYWGGLGILVLAYVVSLGWLLAYTEGLPYVLDNNETFSSLVHARNVHHFGVRETFGLTDESYGLEPAQHPYVYTHGGNFPRFYALFLYTLGARTAEAQIVVTTFTVGLIGLLFAYQFFSRVANPLFALIYCLLLTTDYLMQTQWLVNTWRTWHHFFVFSSLLLVHRLVGRRRQPRWLAATTLLNFACLAYLELVFAAFVTLLAIVYAGLVGRRRPGRVLRGWSLIVGGAVLGAAVLAAQLVGYLGWEGFLEDVRLTFVARNTALADLRGFRAEVWSFVEEHRLVFWDNFLAGGGSYSEVLRWCLVPYTPALVFVSWLISTGWALSSLPFLASVSVAKRSHSAWSARSAIPLAAGAATLFVCATLMDVSFAGLSDASRGLGGVGVLTAWSAGAAGAGLWLAVDRRLRDGMGDGIRLPASRVVGAAALLLVYAALARFHPLLYGDGNAVALFRERIGRTGGATLWHLAALGAGGLAVGLVLAPRSLMGRERRRFERLWLFVIAGVVAVATILGLIPGYVATGYVERYCPLTIYLHLVPFAAAFYVLIRVSLNALKARASRAEPLTTRDAETSPSELQPGIAAGLHRLVSVGAMLLLCLLSWYWLSLQARWIAVLDPRSAVLEELQKPQYEGASFVVNTYAAPVAYVTGGWAYFDPLLGRSELRKVEGKFYLRRDFRYLWLADKRSNRQYFEPDYFVCWVHPLLRDAAVLGEECSELQIVAEARAGTSLLGHREVFRDESRRDAWSIIKLNWTYPPGSGKKLEWHDRQYRRALAVPE
jgi:hypothetical protein